MNLRLWWFDHSVPTCFFGFFSPIIVFNFSQFFSCRTHKKKINSNYIMWHKSSPFNFKIEKGKRGILCHIRFSIERFRYGSVNSNCTCWVSYRWTVKDDTPLIPFLCWLSIDNAPAVGVEKLFWRFSIQKFNTCFAYTALFRFPISFTLFYSFYLKKVRRFFFNCIQSLFFNNLWWVTNRVFSFLCQVRWKKL